MHRTNPPESAPKPLPHTLQPTQPERLIRLPEVLRTVSFGRTAWLDLVKAGDAPQPIKIGRATFWQASELQAWIAASVRAARGVR